MDISTYVNQVFENPPPDLKEILENLKNKKFPDYPLPDKPWSKDSGFQSINDEKKWRKGISATYIIQGFPANPELTLAEAYAWGWRVAKDHRKDVWISGVDKEASDEDAASMGLIAVRRLLEEVGLRNLRSDIAYQTLNKAEATFELQPVHKLAFYTDVVGRLAREKRITQDQGIDLRHVFVLSVDNPELTGDVSAEREGSFLNRLEDINKVSSYLIGKLTPEEVVKFEEAASETVFGRLIQWNFSDPKMIAAMFRKISPWAEKHPRFQELVSWAQFNENHQKAMLDPAYAKSWAETADMSSLMKHQEEMMALGGEVQAFALESFLNEWRDKLLDPKYKGSEALFDLRIKELHELASKDQAAFDRLNLSQDDLKKIAAYDLAKKGPIQESKFPWWILIVGAYLIFRRMK